MASQAEVDLIVNASRTLPELERDLDRVITAAQAGMDDVDVTATLDTRDTIRGLIRDLDAAAATASADADDIQMTAILNQRATLANLHRDLGRVADAAAAGSRDDIALIGVLNTRSSITNLRRDVDEVVRRTQATAPDITIDVDIDRDRLAQFARTALSSLGSLTSGVAKFGGAAAVAGSATGLLAAALQNIVPAAAVATQGMLAMQLVSGTLKLGMQGVQEAIATAFDPEATPEELAESMKGLAPEAQKFVKALTALKGEFKELQLDVQGRLFDGLGDDITRLSRSVLPDVGSALGRTADSLNNMARGAVDAADKLGKSGVLDTALKGATNGLQNLEKVPGRVVTGFGLIAAAAAPAFERITLAVDRVSKDIADKLTEAFENGSLDTAINDALDLIKQLGASAGNILGGLRSIFQGLTTDGRGLFDILENLTQGFQDIAEQEDFQNFLKELALTGDSLVKNVLPLLKEAVVVLAPALAALGPPTREFLDAVGPPLKDAITALGPILLDLAEIFQDQMPTAIAFVTAVLQDLIPIFEAIHFVLQNLVIPILKGVSDVINSDFVKALAAASEAASKDVGAILKSGEDFRVGLTSAVTTVITRFGELRDSVGRSLASVASQARTSAANFASALIGKAIEAKTGFVRAVSQLAADALGRVRALPGQIRSALGNLGGLLFSAGAAVIRGFISGIQSQIARLAGVLQDITSRLPEWKGPADVDANILFHSGQLVMKGFQDGIASQVGSLQAQLGSITAAIPAAVGGSRLTVPKNDTVFQPRISVLIGNEQLAPYIQRQIDQVNFMRNRTAAQGVRR